MNTLKSSYDVFVNKQTQLSLMPSSQNQGKMNPNETSGESFPSESSTKKQKQPA
jgi:hypothetical protein